MSKRGHMMSEDIKLEMWKKRRLREMHRAMLSRKIEEEKNKTKKAEKGILKFFVPHNNA